MKSKREIKKGMKAVIDVDKAAVKTCPELFWKDHVESVLSLKPSKIDLSTGNRFVTKMGLRRLTKKRNNALKIYRKCQ